MRSVVTCSNGGIGRAIVNRLASTGAFVVGVDRVTTANVQPVDGGYLCQ